MSYRARCAGRAWRRRKRWRALSLVSSSNILKWHYQFAHPWWIVLSVKHHWVRSIEEAFRLEEEWLEQWPNDRPRGVWGLSYEMHPFFALLRKDVSPGG